MPRTRSLTESTAHTLLADPQRRYLLDLLEQGGNGTVDDLAREIAARERGEQPETVGRKARQRVTISLVHKHLPLLADHNVIQYDIESGTVVLMDVFTELEHYQEDSNQDSDTSGLRNLIPGY